MSTDEIETINDCLVGGNSAGMVTILMPPLGPMDKAKALRLAAWLVAIADPGGDEFAAVHEAVLNT